jgi:hypothetical protein
MTDTQQVIIYFDDPKGQLLQVSYSEYKAYWQLLGWHLEGKAAELPGIVEPSPGQGLQSSLL